MHHTKLSYLCALVATSALFATPSAHAAVVNGNVTGGTSLGSFELLASPPTAAGPDAFQSPNLIAFDEQQGVLLASPLMIGPSTTIPAGITVSSHYVAFDPSTGSTIQGSVLFDKPILAIVGAPPALNATEPLFGAVGTTYSVAPAIGPELPNADNVFVSMANPSRLIFQAAANSPGDQVRVLTGIIPEPATITLMLLAMVGGVGVSRGAQR